MCDQMIDIKLNNQYEISQLETIQLSANESIMLTKITSVESQYLKLFYSVQLNDQF